MSVTTILMILAIIVFAVIPSLKDRIISVRKLVITPAIFLYLLYQTIGENFHPADINAVIILLAVIIGVTLGLLLRRNTQIKVDRVQQQIFLPASYISLINFFLIFTMHFIIGYLNSTHSPFLASGGNGTQLLLFLLTCTSTISLGANLTLYYKYRMYESTSDLPTRIA